MKYKVVQIIRSSISSICEVEANNIEEALENSRSWEWIKDDDFNSFDNEILSETVIEVKENLIN